MPENRSRRYNICLGVQAIHFSLVIVKFFILVDKFKKDNRKHKS